jgi:hypothetical protein
VTERRGTRGFGHRPRISARTFAGSPAASINEMLSLASVMKTDAAEARGPRSAAEGAGDRLGPVGLADLVNDHIATVYAVMAKGAPRDPRVVNL